MVNQTTVQDATKVRKGSAKVEVAVYGTGTYHDIGAIEGLTFKENLTVNTIYSDNAGEISKEVTDHTADISFTMLEINQHHMSILRGGTGVTADTTGLDTYTTAAASEVENFEDVITFSAGTGQNQRLSHANFPAGVATIVTVESVTSETGGAGTTYTQSGTGADDDYTLYLDAEGYTHIVRSSGNGDIAATGTVYVVYHYTPRASQTIKTGATGIGVNPVTLRLTNTNASSKTDVVTFYKCYLTGGMQNPYNADRTGKANGSPITLQAVTDTTRTARDQLFSRAIQE